MSDVRRRFVSRIPEHPSRSGYTYLLECRHVWQSPEWHSIFNSVDTVVCPTCTRIAKTRERLEKGKK